MTRIVSKKKQKKLHLSTFFSFPELMIPRKDRKKQKQHENNHIEEQKQQERKKS